MSHQLTKEELRENKIRREEFASIERNNIYIILDSLKCAHNIGTILRLSDSLLVKKVYICGNTIIPPNKKIKSSSRGAEKWVSWEYHDNPLPVAMKLKNSGIEIVSVEVTNNSIDFRDYNPEDKPVCLIFGREYDGVSQELLDISDYSVHLPLLGMSNSINVSTAASVMLYDVYSKIEANKTLTRDKTMKK